MTKINKREIVSAHVLSASPLVVNIKCRDGSADSYSLLQLRSQLTQGAQSHVYEVIDAPADIQATFRGESLGFFRTHFEAEAAIAKARGRATRQGHLAAGVK